MTKMVATDNLPRLLTHYRQDVVPELTKQFKYPNRLAVPRVEKVVVNVGCGEAAHDAKVLEQAQRDLTLITGQHPVVTRAKKAISNFKIKEGDPVGVRVTLRRARMYEFLDRLISVVIPSVRDFRGLSLSGFDDSGNYSFGIKEQSIFPEIRLDEIHYPLGMDVVIVTTARSEKEALALLTTLGLPFGKAGGS